MNAVAVSQGLEIVKPDLYDLARVLHTLPQVPTPVYHAFQDGMYAREMHIPCGTVIIGKHHRHHTLNIVLQGDISVYDDVNKEALRYTAPCFFMSPPMCQKLGVTHADTIFITVHVTDAESVEAAEKFLIVEENEFKSITKEVT